MDLKKYLDSLPAGKFMEPDLVKVSGYMYILRVTGCFNVF